jgi:replication factor C subunit 1
MDVVLTGKGAEERLGTTPFKRHKVLRPGYQLVVGSECNDGRPITESWRYKQAVKRGIPIVREPVAPAPAPAPAPASATAVTRVTKPMLVDKYAPQKIQDVIGHKESIQQLRTWLSSWDKGYPEQRGVLVTGPPGIGKTTCVHLVARSLGYHVVEYNASDSRSLSALRGLIALGVRRLRKEVIVMDEVDGLSERGGVGEIAAILPKTGTPIFCIANEKPPKLRPIVNACLDIKFTRPMKGVIATALSRVVAAEGIRVSREELEQLCEQNGNDIRSVLHKLEFYGCSAGEGSKEANKDALLRMDLFSATQSLFRQKRASLDEAAGLVYVDYHMVPLMVQEGYVAASGSIEEAAAAAEHLSIGDVLDKRIHVGQEWDLIPDFVQCSVAAAKTVSGLAPFQLFPQWLGKNSKGLKHARYMRELGEKTGRRRGAEMRLDYVTPLQSMLLRSLVSEKADVKAAIQKLDDLGWTRNDVMENLQEVCLDPVEIPTKVKTALTREYNKTHGVCSKGGKKRSASTMEDSASEEEEDMEEIEEGMEEMSL